MESFTTSVDRDRRWLVACMTGLRVREAKRLQWRCTVWLGPMVCRCLCPWRWRHMQIYTHHTPMCTSYLLEIALTTDVEIDEVTVGTSLSMHMLTTKGPNR